MWVIEPRQSEPDGPVGGGGGRILRDRGHEFSTSDTPVNSFVPKRFGAENGERFSKQDLGLTSRSWQSDLLWRNGLRWCGAAGCAGIRNGH